jgi:hypothetical protein
MPSSHPDAVTESPGTCEVVCSSAHAERWKSLPLSEEGALPFDPSAGEESKTDCAKDASRRTFCT